MVQFFSQIVLKNYLVVVHLWGSLPGRLRFRFDAGLLRQVAEIIAPNKFDDALRQAFSVSRLYEPKIDDF